MSTRDFSDSVKLEVIKANLEKNDGKICCEACGTSLSSIRDCHFDHIHPYQTDHLQLEHSYPLD